MLTILIPAYNEEPNVIPMYNAVSKVVKTLKIPYEILFVDDGSKDKTVANILALRRKDKRVRLIEFQRNFGKSNALSAGFAHAKGDMIITMDADLQDDPKEIPRFVRALKKYDLVCGWKFIRKDPIGKTLPSKLFNRLTQIMTGVKVHDSNCCFKGYRMIVAKHLHLHGELHRYIPSLVHQKGFTIGELKVTHHPRRFGKSKYGGSRLFKGFFDLLTVTFLGKYTKRPLHLFGAVGSLMMAAGLLSGLWLVIGWFRGIGIGNRPLLTLTILLIILGVQFVSIGLLGEMLANSSEKKEYIIKRIVE